MTKTVFCDNFVQADKYYKIKQNDSEKRMMIPSSVDHNHKKYTYYGKSNIPNSASHRCLLIFRLIIEGLFIPLTLGLMLFLEPYRSSLKGKINKIKSSQIPIQVYILNHHFTEAEFNILKADSARFFQKLPQKFHAGQRGLDLFVEMPAIFKALQSPNEEIRNWAHAVLEFLQKSGISFDSILHHSLPFGDDFELKEIVLKNANSSHTSLKKYAFFAFLSLQKDIEAAKTIVSIASQMLHDSDEKIQSEGLRYFTLLLRSRPILSETDLLRAIEIAEKLHISTINSNGDEIDFDLSFSGQIFFRELIKNGTKEDILKIRQALKKACASETKCQYGYELCNLLSVTYPQEEELLSICFQLIKTGVVSVGHRVRSHALSSLLTLLQVAPRYILLSESENSNSSDLLISRLQQVSENRLTDLSNKNFANFKEYASLLLPTLNSFSIGQSAEIKEEAEKIINWLNERIII